MFKGNIILRFFSILKQKNILIKDHRNEERNHRKINATWKIN